MPERINLDIDLYVLNDLKKDLECDLLHTQLKSKLLYLFSIVYRDTRLSIEKICAIYINFHEHSFP